MEKTKKTVKFDERLNSHYNYKLHEDVQELSWMQIAIDEMRFRRPLEQMLLEKIKHLDCCDKTCHETCSRFTSSEVCCEPRQ